MVLSNLVMGSLHEVLSFVKRRYHVLSHYLGFFYQLAHQSQVKHSVN